MKSDITEIIKFGVTLFIILAPLITSKKEKKTKNINSEKVKNKKTKKKKVDFYNEISNMLNTEGQKEIVNRDLNLNKKDIEKESEKKNNINQEEYDFSKNSDTIVEKIRKEREQLRETEILRAKENEFRPSFEVDIEEELDSYDLANAMILKEILDKPLSLRENKI